MINVHQDLEIIYSVGFAQDWQRLRDLCGLMYVTCIIGTSVHCHRKLHDLSVVTGD